jgi:hypothetical protein
VTALLLGCYSNYAGIYDLRSAQAGTAPSAAAVAAALKERLAPLGFEPERDAFPLRDGRNRSREIDALTKSGGRPRIENGWKGERAHGDVAVGGERGLSIRIKDYDDAEETEFTETRGGDRGSRKTSESRASASRGDRMSSRGASDQSLRYVRHSPLKTRSAGPSCVRSNASATRTDRTPPGICTVTASSQSPARTAAAAAAQALLPDASV